MTKGPPLVAAASPTNPSTGRAITGMTHDGTRGHHDWSGFITSSVLIALMSGTLYLTFRRKDSL